MAGRWNVDDWIGWAAITVIAIFAFVTFWAFLMRVPHVLAVMMS